MRHNKGFTLLELLLSVAIIGLLTAFSLPVLSRAQTKNDLDTATTTLVQSLRRAQVLSQSVVGDSSWGVKAQSGSITLFQGSSYAARNADYDEALSVPATIAFSGLTESVMAKFTGYPTATGTTTLTNSVLPNDSATVTVNGRGMVEY